MGVLVTVVPAAIGFVLIYCALFLYEDQEGRVQNWLEEWWIRLDDYQSAVIGKHVLFLQAVAKLASSWLDKVFGTRLVSILALSVSACFSVASFCVAAVIGSIVLEVVRPNSRGLPGAHCVVLLALAVLVVVLGGTSHLMYRWGVVLVFRVFLTIPFLLCCPLCLMPWATWVYAVFTVSACFAAIGSDVLFIMLARESLRLGAATASFLVMLLVLLANVTAGGLFVIVPLLTMVVVGVYPPLAWGCGLLVFMNLTVLIPALSLIGLVGVFLVHRIAWPAINRPFYFLGRIGIAKRKKLFFWIGVGLVLPLFPGVANWLKTVLAPLVP